MRAYYVHADHPAREPCCIMTKLVCVCDREREREMLPAVITVLIGKYLLHCVYSFVYQLNVACTMA